MPLGIAPSDKTLLLIGGGVLFVLLIASVVFPPPSDNFNSPIPSTFSSQPAGAQAAYRLLVQLHYPVRRWENPPGGLATDSSGANSGDYPPGEAISSKVNHDKLELASGNILLILAEPNQRPSAKERTALHEFVEEGGHVLFTGSNIRSYFPDANISDENPNPAWESFSPNFPSQLTRGAQQITMQTQAFWGKLNSLQLPIYGDSDFPVVVSWQVGGGEILWWAGSTPLTNAGITRDDNLAFFLNAVGSWSPNAPYKIYWDEYFHGERRSLWSYVQKTSLAWGALQIAVLVFAVLFTFSRRSGPFYIPAGVSRLSPLEFVDTLGGLYERAGAASSVVSVSYPRLRALLTRQLGLASNTPDPQLALAAEQRLGWKQSGLAASLHVAEMAAQLPKLPSREALEIVQKLEQFAARLHVRAQFQRENT